MCDCLPDNFRSNFRCRKKSRYLPFDLGFDLFGIALELTVVHIWLYMIILGILIAFILKTISYCMSQRNSQSKNKKKDNAACTANGASCSSREPSSCNAAEEKDSLCLRESNSNSSAGCGSCGNRY